MDTEYLATAAIKRAIATTETLTPFIPEGDKEPSWDGHIYIYKDKNKGKQGLKRVPVQVKGEIRRKIDNKKTYSLDRSDLDNYLREGGTILFVVYISEDGENEQIYFAQLLPVKIKQILSKSNKRKTTIAIEPFPDNNAEKETILLDFYSHMKKQTGIANVELKSLDELQNAGILESITSTVMKSPRDMRSPAELFLNQDTYFYANIKGSSLPVPLPELGYWSQVEQVDAEVLVSKEPFYSSFRRIRDKDGYHIEIGESTKVSIDEGAGLTTLNFSLTSLLPQAITDIGFFLAIIKHHGFEINKTPFVFNSLNVSDDEIERLDLISKHYQQVVDVLDMLRINHGVDIKSFSLEDKLNTDRFIKAFLCKKPVSGLKAGIPFLTVIGYLGYKIALCFQPTEDPQTYHLFEYFSTPLAVTFKDSDGNTHVTSQFDVLTCDDYLDLQNADFNSVADSYLALTPDKYVAERENNTLLMLLLAFDKSNETRIDILNCAEELAEHLMDNYSEDMMEGTVRFINLAQVRKRLGKLMDSDREQLYTIGCDEDNRKDIRVAAYLLIDEFYSANRLFNELDQSTKEAMSSYPIFRYWPKGRDY